ncbi:MAG: class I SAM-dependent methyltransferase [Sphingobacteriaceae bacterium]|nr:class I SAM-dependent methyltransferase [Sphingobacteriaceae bacterium]
MDKSKIAVDIFNKHANLYQTKFMDVSLYHASFDFFCDSIKKQNAEVLELACGPGNITKYLLIKRPDLKLLGTDLAPNMIELAKQNNPSAAFEILDSRKITSLNKNYDAIMCGFCLPYLSKEETIQLIEDAYKILNPGGLIYISTMEDDYSKSGLRKGSQGDEIFMHYYLEKDLSEPLIKNGFQINHVSRVKSEMTDGSVVTDLILIAEKI